MLVGSFFCISGRILSVLTGKACVLLRPLAMQDYSKFKHVERFNDWSNCATCFGQSLKTGI